MIDVGHNLQQWRTLVEKCGTYLNHLTNWWSHKQKPSFTGLEVPEINAYLDVTTINVCAFFGYVLKLCVHTEEVYLVIRGKEELHSVSAPFFLCFPPPRNKCS